METLKSRRFFVQLCSEEMDDFVGEYATDVSSAALFLATPRLRPVGTRLCLQFTPAGTERVIEVLGRVRSLVHADADGEEQGMEIEFLELTPEAQALVDQMVQRWHALPQEAAQ